MTERRTKRRRLSKRALRALAWVAGGVAFFSPWTVLGAAPKPAAGEAPKAKSPRQVVIVRKITRRVIVQDTAKVAPVRYVSSSSGGSAPAAAPVTTTSGSTPPP